MLSVKPCCADNDCNNKTITKKEGAGKKPVKEKDCTGCSPFFTCGTCAGFVIASPVNFDHQPLTETQAKIYTAYQQPDLQQVSLSIWQPPQLS